MKLAAFGGLMAIVLPACWGSELGNLESKQHNTITAPVPKEPFDAELVAACGDGGVTPAGEEALVRWPYLQKMTDHGVSIMWTAVPGEAPAELRVTTPEGDEVTTVQAQVDPQSTRDSFTQYATAIDGLEPDTIYCYEIVGSSAWLDPVGFRTAPEAGSDVELQMVVIGDVGTQTSDQFAVRDEMMNVPFDLVLVTGDLAYDSGTLSDHERNFFEVYREILMKKPMFVISGNHDYASAGAIFREVFGLFENGGAEGFERWYSFHWGPVHVTAIDTEQLIDAQAAWVDQDIGSCDQPWKLAFMHRPAFSSGDHGSSPTIQQMFVPHFERYGVDLVLAGHDHDYERTDPINGVTYVVTGGAGRGTRPVGRSSFTAYSEAVAHLTHITIGDDVLKLNAIDAAGGDFDLAYIE